MQQLLPCGCYCTLLVHLLAPTQHMRCIVASLCNVCLHVAIILHRDGAMLFVQLGNDTYCSNSLFAALNLVLCIERDSSAHHMKTHA